MAALVTTQRSELHGSDIEGLENRLTASTEAGNKVRSAVAAEVAKGGHMNFGLAVASRQLRAEVEVLKGLLNETGRRLLATKQIKCCGAPKPVAKAWSWWGAEQVTWAVALAGAMYGALDPSNKIAGAVSAVSNLCQGTFSQLGKHELDERAGAESQVTRLYEIQTLASRAIKEFRHSLTFYEVDVKVQERFSPEPRAGGGGAGAASAEETKATGTDQDSSTWLVEEMRRVGASSLLSLEELAARWLSKVPRASLASMPPFPDCYEGQILEKVRKDLLKGDPVEFPLSPVEPGRDSVVYTPHGGVKHPSGIDLIEVTVDSGRDLDAATPMLCISAMERIVSNAEAVGEALRGVVARSAELTRSRSGNYTAVQEEFERYLRRVRSVHGVAERVLSQRKVICGVESDTFKTRTLTVLECTTWVTNVAVAVSSVFAEDYFSLRALNVGFLLAQGTISNFNNRVRKGIAKRQKTRGRYERLRDDAADVIQRIEGSLAILKGHNIERVGSPELVAKALEERLRLEAASRTLPERRLARRLVASVAGHVPTESFSDTHAGILLKNALEDVQRAHSTSSSDGSPK